MAGTERREPRTSLGARRAIGRAWAWWGGLLAMPVVLLLVAAGLSVLEQALSWSVGAVLFLVLATLWLVLVLPGVLVLRSHCLRAAWRGRPLRAEAYLRGMRTVWGTLEVAALLGVLGAVASGSWLPCLLPTAIAWSALALLSPSERAMEPA